MQAEEENERLATDDEVQSTQPEAEVSTDESDAEAEVEEQAQAEPESEPGDEEKDEEAVETEEQEEPEEEADETEVEEVTASHAYESDDPRVLAFLAKYDNDPERALMAAAHLEQVLGRPGRDLGLQQDRITELEQELGNLRAFGPGVVTLTPEQREWAVQAVESENPVAYVQEAMRAGEFALARAVCDGWSEAAPYEAARLAQHIDGGAWQMGDAQTRAQEPEELQFDQSVRM